MASFSKQPIHQRKSFSKDGHEGLVFLPQPGKHSATIIFMHGLGDSADGLEDIITLWGDEFPQVKFILPTAKQLPITVYMGQRANAWYDIVHLADAAEEKDRDPSTGLDESKAFIQSIVEDEVRHGIALCRILLGGFSQGGAMTLTVGLQLSFLDNKEQEGEEAGTVLSLATRQGKYPPHLGGLLVMSGYLPKKYAFRLDERSIEVPILHVHGAADPLVVYPYAEKTREFVIGLGVKDYQLKSFAKVGHTLSMEMLEESKAFLHQRLSVYDGNSNPDFLVFPKHPKDLSLKEIKELVKEFQLQSKARGLSEKSEFVQLLVDHYQSHFQLTF